ncbi:N4-gp56 family major capsid protein [Clostridium sp. KNHs214]|uniref:N4-gp56 family major capsid protein n=1 Tax=Clostridium sp. KNHs214 TaxID=1540257 RepID=UPI0005534AC3|nr:N4-gp56 family major capsid protein [Clostridium sp. KNHs214]
MANTLINNVVLGEVIGATLPNKLKFAPVSKVNNTLTHVAGDTIKVEKYGYIGEAVDVAEGKEIPISDLAMTSQDVTVKKAAKGIKLTDEEVIRRGQEVVNEGKKQLEMSLADKIDSDCYTALKGAKAKYDGTKDTIGYESIVKATAMFGEEDDEAKVLFINPLQKASLQLDSLFTRASDMGDKVVSTGVIGEIAGCQIIVSGKVKSYKKTINSASTDVFDNPIVKVGALGIEMAKSVNIEEDRHANTKSSEYYGDEHYVAYVRDETKVVLMTTLKDKPVA